MASGKRRQIFSGLKYSTPSLAIDKLHVAVEPDPEDIDTGKGGKGGKKTPADKKATTDNAQKKKEVSPPTTKKTSPPAVVVYLYDVLPTVAKVSRETFGTPILPNSQNDKLLRRPQPKRTALTTVWLEDGNSCNGSMINPKLSLIFYPTFVPTTGQCPYLSLTL